MGRRMPDPRASARGLEEQQQGKMVWQGRFGDAPLRVDLLPSEKRVEHWIEAARKLPLKITY